MDKVYYKLDKEELDWIKEISKKTMTDYELQADMFPIESLNSLLFDIICKIHSLEEEFEDYKENVKDNYRQLTPEEMGWE